VDSATIPAGEGRTERGLKIFCLGFASLPPVIAYTPKPVPNHRIVLSRPPQSRPRLAAGLPPPPASLLPPPPTLRAHPARPHFSARYARAATTKLPSRSVATTPLRSDPLAAPPPPSSGQILSQRRHQASYVRRPGRHLSLHRHGRPHTVHRHGRPHSEPLSCKSVSPSGRRCQAVRLRRAPVLSSQARPDFLLRSQCSMAPVKATRSLLFASKELIQGKDSTDASIRFVNL
jgi:hypothetical protein